jgi:hypothetical protein
MSTMLLGFLVVVPLTGCTDWTNAKGVNIFSSALDRGLCEHARAGNEDVQQCLEAQQARKR